LRFSIYSQRLTRDLQAQNLLLQRLLTHFSPKVRQRLLEARRARPSDTGEADCEFVSEASLGFPDIRGFTRMTRDDGADDVLDMLNAYFAHSWEAIFRCEGTVDKFIGDAIWRYRESDPDPEHHRQALHAAPGHAGSGVQKLNGERKARNQPVCEIGIGVHSATSCTVLSERRAAGIYRGGRCGERASRFCAAAGANELL